MEWDDDEHHGDGNDSGRGTQTSRNSPGKRAPEGQREIRYEHSTDLADVLRQARCTLLVSTYQAGKLVVIGSHDDNVAMSFHNFDRPMGVAATADRR